MALSMPALPIPLDVLRTRLKIEVESDDVDLAALCVAAGELIERETGLALSSASRSQKIRRFSRFIPRVQPVTQFTSVTYTDANGAAQTLLAAFGDTSEERRRNAWGFLVLEACGDIHAAQGRKAEALAKYRDALGIKAHQGYMDRVNKKITDLKNAEGDPK